MGELTGRTDGQREPRSAGAPRARPCASVRSCVRAPVCPRVRRARRKGGPGADARVSPGCRLQVAGCRGPPSPCCSVPWASRVAPAPGSSRERPAAPLPGSPRGGRGRPSSGPAGHFNVTPSSRPPCVSSPLPPWASGK